VLFQVVALAVAATSVDIAVFSQVVSPARAQVDSTLSDQVHVLEGAIELRDGVVAAHGGSLPDTNDSGLAIDGAVVANGRVVLRAGGSAVTDRALVDVAQPAAQSDVGIYRDLVDSRGAPRRLYAEQQSLGNPPNQVATVVLASRSSQELRDTTTRLVATLAAGSLAVVAVGGILAWLIVGRAFRPVRGIAAAAAQISDRDLRRRVPESTPDDELGHLVATFNRMLERLEAAFMGLRRFTADASHELRAPLALMRTEVEVALTEDREPREYAVVLRSVLEEVEHLSRIADQLLLLAQSDAGTLHPGLQTVDVADFLHETAARWNKRADARDVSIEVDAPDVGTVAAEPDLLRRILDNLVDNALRYAPALSSIKIEARPKDGGWVIEVSDHGPGIPPDLRQAIFTRFARADTVRTRRSSGAGLGLAVSAALAEVHSGSLQLVDGDGPGCVFRLSLPGRKTPP